MKKINLIMPILATTGIAGMVIPLASCSCGNPESTDSSKVTETQWKEQINSIIGSKNANANFTMEFNNEGTDYVYKYNKEKRTYKETNSEGTTTKYYTLEEGCQFELNEKNDQYYRSLLSTSYNQLDDFLQNADLVNHFSQATYDASTKSYTYVVTQEIQFILTFTDGKISFVEFIYENQWDLKCKIKDLGTTTITDDVFSKITDDNIVSFDNTTKKCSITPTQLTNYKNWICKLDLPNIGELKTTNSFTFTEGAAALDQSNKIDSICFGFISEYYDGEQEDVGSWGTEETTKHIYTLANDELTLTKDAKLSIQVEFKNSSTFTGDVGIEFKTV